jgi:hypothetical protein
MQAADWSAGKPGRVKARFRQTSGSARPLDKIGNEDPGFSPRTALDPAGRINRVRARDLDSFPDIFRSEATGQDHLPAGLSGNKPAHKLPIQP